MTLIKGFSFQHCINQAIDAGLGIPDSTIRANGKWRFIYLNK